MRRKGKRRTHWGFLAHPVEVTLFGQYLKPPEVTSSFLLSHIRFLTHGVGLRPSLGLREYDGTEIPLGAIFRG